MKVLSQLKNLVVPHERKVRTILAGPFGDLAMSLSLQSQLQVYLGLFEKETHPWLRQFSRDIGTAFDIGLAEGEYSLFFLKKTTARKVYAFEPEAKCIAIAKENFAINGFAGSDRLSISQKFVGATDTDIEIRLDSFVDSVTGPCFIKMDVDGGEVDALNGAVALNRLPDVRWLIETHSKDLEASCVRILEAAGFKTQIIPNAWWRAVIPEMRPGDHNRWLVAWNHSAAR